MLAYNPCQPDDRLRLTANAFNQLKRVYQQSWSQEHYHAELAVSSPAVAKTIFIAPTHGGMARLSRPDGLESTGMEYKYITRQS